MRQHFQCAGGWRFFSDCRAPSPWTGTKCFFYVLVNIKDCHVQKVTVHAARCSAVRRHGLIKSPVAWCCVERVLRMLISCPVCHGIPLTRSVFMFGTIEDTPNIIRTRCIGRTGLCRLYKQRLFLLSTFHLSDRTSVAFILSFRHTGIAIFLLTRCITTATCEDDDVLS